MKPDRYSQAARVLLFYWNNDQFKVISTSPHFIPLKAVEPFYDLQNETFTLGPSQPDTIKLIQLPLSTWQWELWNWTCFKTGFKWGRRVGVVGRSYLSAYAVGAGKKRGKKNEQLMYWALNAWNKIQPARELKSQKASSSCALRQSSAVVMSPSEQQRTALLHYVTTTLQLLLPLPLLLLLLLLPPLLLLALCSSNHHRPAAFNEQ